MIYLSTIVVVFLWGGVVMALRSWRGGRWIDQLLERSARRQRFAAARAAASFYVAFGTALFVTGAVTMTWCERTGQSGSTLYHAANATAASGFAVMALALWVWLLMWPDFLVAPPLRGAEGVARRSRSGTSDSDSTVDHSKR